MSKMIQIRNVPDAIHRTLKVRAASSGMTLSDYLLRELRGVADRPTIEELVARIQAHGPARARLHSAAAVRAERSGR